MLRLLKQTIPWVAHQLLHKLIPTLMLALVVFAAWRVASSIETPTQDALIRLTAQPVHDSSVVLVLIDDESIQHLNKKWGHSSWTHPNYLDIVRLIADYPIQSLVVDTHGLNDQRTSSQVSPSLSEKIKFSMDKDGVVRGIRWQGENKRLQAPALGLKESFRPHWYAAYKKAPILSNSLADESETLFVSHQVIPLWRFLDDKTKPPSSALKNRIVVLGVSVSSHRHYYATPMSPMHLGADIRATAIDNVLTETTLAKAPLWKPWVITTLICIAIFGLRMKVSRYSLYILYLVLWMAGYGWWVVAELSVHQQLWPLVIPEVAFLLTSLFGSSMRLLTRDRDMSRLEKTMSQLVSPAILKELKKRGKHHQLIQAEGSRMEISAMYVDIRNFTHLASTLPASDITIMLNEFYERVVNTAFRHRGTVDKFVGDAVLVLFGAPVNTPEHAQQAFEAAIAIQKALDPLLYRWKCKYGVSTSIGISIATGQAFVGLVGPPNRLEYTAIGDTVNLCVRLQAVNKKLAQSIVISPNTFTALDTPLPIVPLEPTRLRGYTTPITSYGVRLNVHSVMGLPFHKTSRDTLTHDIEAMISSSSLA